MMSCPPRSTSEPREEQAHAFCLRLLTARPRTRADLSGHLVKRGYPEVIVNAVLTRLERVGLIDDGEFADQWVRSRQANAGKAKRALAAELRGKGVEDDVIATALEGIDSTAERRRAEQLVDGRLRRATLDGDDDAKVMRRLVGMLARRGYHPGMAVAVVTEALSAERERRRV